MTDHRAEHPLDWRRFVGAFANTADGHGFEVEPTVGVAWHSCECCGRGYLVIAAIAPDGREVNVALPGVVALDLLEHGATLVERASAGRTATRKAFLQ